MKIAYFDCFAGVSGDMVLGALIDVGVSVGALEAELKKVPVGGYSLEVSRVTRQGIAATRVEIIDKVGVIYSPRQMIAVTRDSALPPDVARTAVEMLERLIAAEARVHGIPPDQVYFHELGSVDTIVDVVGAAAGLALLRVDDVYASQVNVGSGMARGAHGPLPVPAPATLELLRGIHCFSLGDYETTTPTGAAIVSTVAGHSGVWPELTPEAIGYGAGARDSPIPNVLRLVVGSRSEGSAYETLVAIETNIDDMNPQFYEHVGEALLGRGAIDYFVTPVLMKKGRPGQLLTVLAQPDRLDDVMQTLFEETTTLGVRMREIQRIRLEREERIINTQLGRCRVKVASLRRRVVNIAPEYEDCRRLAREHGLSLKEVHARMLATARAQLLDRSPADG